jgi:hypothetical protein
MLSFDFGPDLDSWSLAENNHAAIHEACRYHGARQSGAQAEGRGAVFSFPRPRGRYLLARTGSVATEGDDSRSATRTGTGAARKKPVGYEQRTPAGITSGTSARSATRIRRRSR